MKNESFLKNYAIKYLSKYNSSKKNLKRILKNKIFRLKNLNDIEKKMLFREINLIANDLEKKKLINDENFTINKIQNYISIGKSKNFILSNLIKKGIEKKTIDEKMFIIENEDPDWEMKSAEKFLKKKKLGKFSIKKNKNFDKDIAKMARAGFSYTIIKKLLK